MDLLKKKWVLEILSTIAREGEISPYQMTKKIKEAKYGEVNAKFKLLEKCGLIELKRKESESRVAKYYSLTPKGKEFLKDSTAFLRSKTKEEIESSIEVILMFDEKGREFLEELKEFIEQKFKKAL